MHSDSFDSIDGTIKVKVQQCHKPRSFLHITRFCHCNPTDIQEELQALEELEHDVKHLSHNTNIAKIIRTRSHVLKTL